MWFYYLGGAVVAKMAYNRVRKAWLQYKGLKDLRTYGEQVSIPYVPGEEVEKYRTRLIDARNKASGTGK
jgi:hypothetical protein